MTSGQGITIEDRNGTVYLTGPLNEYGDLSSILSRPAPLTLNLRGITRINSIGIRNFLKFLSGWGDKPLSYEECTVEFVDQVNMIPSLLGIKQQASIASLEIPYECTGCDREGVTLATYGDAVNHLKSNSFPKQACQSCGSAMTPMIDTYFSFVKK